MTSPYPIICILVAVIHLCIGTSVFLKSPRERTNQTFYLANISLVLLMLLGGLIFQYEHQLDVKMILTRIGYATGMLTTGAITAFCFAFSHKKRSIRKPLALVYLVCAVFLLFSLLPGMVLEGFKTDGPHIIPIPGLLHAPYYVTASLLFWYGLYQLWKRHKETPFGEERLQLKLLGAGILIPVLVILTAHGLVFPYFVEPSPLLFSIGPMSTMAFILLAGYSLLRQGLFTEMDIALEHVFNSISAGICVIQVDGRIARHNRRLAEILEYEGDFEGQSIDDLIVLLESKMEGNTVPLRQWLELRQPESIQIILSSLNNKCVDLIAGRLCNTKGKRIGTVCLFHDVTERRRADEALRESEEMYRLNFENVNDIVYSLDPEFRCTTISPSVEAILGYRPEEFIGRKFGERNMLAPEDRERAISDLMRVMAGGRITSTEYGFIAKDGTKIFIEVSVSPVIRDGSVVSLIAVGHNVTERKRAEEELEGSLSLLHATLESTADGILVVHKSGKVVSYNKKFLQMWRVPESLVTSGHDVQTREIILDQLRQPEKFLRRVEELYDNPELQGYDNIELADGRIFERYTQPRRVGGEIVGRVLSFRNVTEHKRLEKQLRETKNYLENLLENANDAIYTLDLEGILTYVNHRTEDITGYSRNELLGESIASLLHPDDHPDRTERHKNIENGKAQITRLRIIRKDGGVVTLSINETPIIKAEEVVGVFGIGRDITREVGLEEQLRQAQKLEAVGQLAGGVAHDFNNLLTVILGHTQLAMMQAVDGSSLRNDLHEVETATQRAAELTSQLLAFSRKQVIQPKVVDLNVTLSIMKRLLRRLIREDIDLRLELAPGLWRIMADPGQVEQVIVNLIVNACDATLGGGSILIETANIHLGDEQAQELGDTKPGRYVMLAVTDTGHGMSKEIQSRIFEPFFTTKPESKGTGLGLSTVYGIAKQHGGGIWCHSEVGRGTTFKVYVPAADTKNAEQRLIGSTQIPQGYGTILVVEDEESVRRMMARTLSELGYTVWEAPDGLQALDLLDEHAVAPDMLITDVVMPGIGGEKLAEECERRVPGVRVLFISGYTDSAIQRDGFLNPEVELLQKPFTSSSLALRVRDLLADQCRSRDRNIAIS